MLDTRYRGVCAKVLVVPGEELELPDGSVPRALWAAARGLDPTGYLEWTFPLFLHRALALQQEHGPETPRGLDIVYEPLATWDDVFFVLRLRDALLNAENAALSVPEVSLGLEVFDGVFRAPQGRLALPARDEPFRGRHAVGFLDIWSDDELRFLNSWGSWGDDGAGYISRSYFEHHVDAAWVTRASWFGPSPAMETELRATAWRAGRPGRVEFGDVLKHWKTGNRPFGKEVRLRGVDYSVKCRSTYSLRGEMQRLQMADVRCDERVVGRLHLRHDLVRNRTFVEELFVSPADRRRGIAMLLIEDIATELARRQGAQQMQLWLHEADADDDGAQSARAFADRLGFQWHDTAMRRPNILGIAERAIL